MGCGIDSEEFCSLMCDVPFLFLKVYRRFKGQAQRNMREMCRASTSTEGDCSLCHYSLNVMNM